MMDYKKVEKKIVKFIKDQVNDAGAYGVVLGMSGGLDSSVCATLCVKALGKENVTALIMPADGSTPVDMGDAQELARKLGIGYKVIPLTNALHQLTKNLRHEHLAYANMAPRIRMALMYYHANMANYLVIGCGNKSELMTGYFTKFGDGGCDIMPIGELYKTEVMKLAQHLELPEGIINKAPSANLWPGQTDEQELGMSYAELDKILPQLKEKDAAISKKTGIGKNKIAQIKELVERSAHKRNLPPICKI